MAGSWYPTMAPLAKEFTKARAADEAGFPTIAERTILTNELGIDIGDKEYARNLERLMELLFSLRFSLSRSTLARAKDHLKVVNSIQKVQAFLWGKCTNGAFANGDSTVGTLYETFYRKLVLRNRSLPRPWIFTTNYDLFNETAMDRLGLPYANGFSGVVERRFNPATFRYALAEQLDLTNRKWSAVDGFISAPANLIGWSMSGSLRLGYVVRMLLNSPSARRSKNLQRRTGRCRSCTIERHHPFEGATMRRHNGHRATGGCRRKADMTQ